MGRKRSYGSNFDFEPVDLSEDQTPRNPKEYARLMDEHPGEESTGNLFD
jgi:hypothetical protein